MKQRTLLLITTLAILATVSSPMPVSAQRYAIPDSLAYLDLPPVPADFVRQVVKRERGVMNFFDLECPSDWGWSEEVYNGLLEAVKTDFDLRMSMAIHLGTVLTVESRPENRIRCPADMPRYEAWMVDQVRREWAEGLLYPPDDIHSVKEAVAPWIVDDLGYSRHTGVGEMLRGIARDAEVDEYTREDAVGSWVIHRTRTMRESLTEAYKAVLLDMTTAAPVPRWEDWVIEEIVKAEGEDFRCEYQRTLEANGPRPTVEPPPDLRNRIPIGQAVFPEPDPCKKPPPER